MYIEFKLVDFILWYIDFDLKINFIIIENFNLFNFFW